ncbi:MAG: CDP-2,3-bis-(O-geranylgeranyl)-sn-glycerol synthase [Candidatus Methanomethylicia archaeon]
MNMIKEMFLLIWKVLPAYIANATPLIMVRSGHPIDLNKKFIDGRPLLGPGKTIEGFFVGFISGILTGLLQNPGNLMRAFTLSLGAMLGDLLGSFIKRRLNIGRGRPAPFLDQATFIIVALLLSSKFESYTIWEMFTIILITIPIHLITNMVAYMVGIKKVPW